MDTQGIRLCIFRFALGLLLFAGFSMGVQRAMAGGVAPRALDRQLVALVDQGDTVTSRGVAKEEAKGDAWRSVVVTRQEKEVKGMRHLEDFDVTLSAPRGNRRAKAEELEAGAIVQLQKRAAAKRATHLLVKEVKFMTAYGEPPSIRVVAQCYRKLKTQ